MLHLNVSFSRCEVSLMFMISMSNLVDEIKLCNNSYLLNYGFRGIPGGIEE